jgi:hypothetical protein
MEALDCGYGVNKVDVKKALAVIHKVMHYPRIMSMKYL